MLDEQGRIAEIAIRERLDAHRVVEDFMIAANVAAAQALEAKTAPVVYRIHEPPAREKLIALRDYLQTFGSSPALGHVIPPGMFNPTPTAVDDEAEKYQVMATWLRRPTPGVFGPPHTRDFRPA